jgi:hypothetical protein
LQCASRPGFRLGNAGSFSFDISADPRREWRRQNACSDLESFGTAAYEPLWLWVRLGIASIANLAGRTVAIGAAGAGTQTLARLLLGQSFWVLA